MNHNYPKFLKFGMVLILVNIHKRKDSMGMFLFKTVYLAPHALSHHQIEGYTV